MSRQDTDMGNGFTKMKFAMFQSQSICSTNKISDDSGRDFFFDTENRTLNVKCLNVKF